MAPRALISWAHRHRDMSEDEVTFWRTQVEAFAEIMRSHWGVDAVFDVYQPGSEDFTRWGSGQIDDCEFVLIIASKAYRERWEGRNLGNEGAGAVREIDTLKGLFNRDQFEFNKKCMIVRLPTTTDEDIPNEIFGRLQRFKVNPLDAQTAESLAQRLHGHNPHPPAPLAAVPTFEALPSAAERLRAITPLPSAREYQARVSRIAADLGGLPNPPAPPDSEAGVPSWRWLSSEWLDVIARLLREAEEVEGMSFDFPRPSVLRSIRLLRTHVKDSSKNIISARSVADAIASAHAQGEIINLLHGLVTQILDR